MSAVEVKVSSDPKTWTLSPDQVPEGFAALSDTFPGSNGSEKIFYRFQQVKGATRPVGLLVLHGHGEHGGRYASYAPFFRELGGIESILIPDHRGHGRSEGLRGHAKNFDDLVDDAALAARLLKKKLNEQFGSSEVHLLGHSLGGHIALRLLMNHPELEFASATVSAPFLAVKAQVPWVKLVAARVMDRIWNTLQLPTALDASGLSRIEAAVEVYKNDRLVHELMTPRFYMSMKKAWSDTLSREAAIRTPLQVIVPLADPIVDPQTTIQFFDRLKLEEKRLKQFESSRHEPMNDLDREQVFAEIGAWIRENTHHAS